MGEIQQKAKSFAEISGRIPAQITESSNATMSGGIPAGFYERIVGEIYFEKSLRNPRRNYQ